jgi:hypothetical protein
VHQAQRLIAERTGPLDDDAERDQVVHLVERELLLLELLPEAVDLLQAAGHLALQLLLLERGRESDAHGVHVALAPATRPLDAPRDLLVDVGVQHAEGPLLQLLLHPVDPEPVGQRGVDVERLARDALARVLTHVLERTHVVQAVGELDQDDADVLRHREQHLSEVLRLVLLAALELDLAELREARDQRLDLLAELLLELLRGGERVLDRVVQQAHRDRHGVEPHVGQDLGDRQRMAQVGLARQAHLPLVHLGRVDVGPLQHAQVRVGEVGLDALDDFVDPRHLLPG